MFRASRALAAVLGVQAIGLLVTYAQTVPAAAVPASSAARARESAVLPGKGPVGWDVYRRLDELSALTSGVVTKQFSSFQRSGGNDDFWSTPDQCQRVDHGTCVVAEHVGPGVAEMRERMAVIKQEATVEVDRQWISPPLAGVAHDRAYRRW